MAPQASCWKRHRQELAASILKNSKLKLFEDVTVYCSDGAETINRLLAYFLLPDLSAISSTERDKTELSIILPDESLQFISIGLNLLYESVLTEVVLETELEVELQLANQYQAQENIRRQNNQSDEKFTGTGASEQPSCYDDPGQIKTTFKDFSPVLDFPSQHFILHDTGLHVDRMLEDDVVELSSYSEDDRDKQQATTLMNAEIPTGIHNIEAATTNRTEDDSRLQGYLDEGSALPYCLDNSDSVIQHQLMETVDTVDCGGQVRSIKSIGTIGREENGGKLLPPFKDINKDDISLATSTQDYSISRNFVLPNSSGSTLTASGSQIHPPVIVSGGLEPDLTGYREMPAAGSVPPQQQDLVCDQIESKIIRYESVEPSTSGSNERSQSVQNLPNATSSDFICGICGKQFSSQCVLKRHIKCVHHNYTEKCEICGKEIRLDNLSAHRLLHTSRDRFTCPIEKCAKSFARSADLRIHMRKHTGSDLYSCQTCGKKFCTLTSFKYHIRTHPKEDTAQESGGIEGTKSDVSSITSSGQNPQHTCTVCFKEFLTGSKLKRHMAKHSDDKDFQCAICEKKFKQLGILKVHLKKLHNITSLPDLRNPDNKSQFLCRNSEQGSS